MKLTHYLFFCITLLSFSAAHAHEDAQRYNQISLDATASVEVENDTMVASLFVQEEGTKASELSSQVNTKINWALEQLKSHDSIKVETEGYSTSPVYKKSQIIAWRVRQSIKLESKDMALMSQLIGELQAQLKLDGISFDVSREKREQQTELLIDKALSAYSARAKQIANNLQHDSYKIVNIHVSTSSVAPRQKYRSAGVMMAEAAVVAPDFSGGERTLTVRVNGTIELD
jgi:predicted secreted protein